MVHWPYATLRWLNIDSNPRQQGVDDFAAWGFVLLPSRILPENDHAFTLEINPGK
jgi:hypothetical protein